MTEATLIRKIRARADKLVTAIFDEAMIASPETLLSIRQIEEVIRSAFAAERKRAKRKTGKEPNHG